MTICNDSEIFRKSIFNRKRTWNRYRNRNDIRIHIISANQEEQSRCCKITAPASTLTPAKPSKIVADHSKYCMVLELLTVKCSRDRSGSRGGAPIHYLLCKITQLCLVVVLLFPFLITYNALIKEASGEGVEGVAVSISKIPNLQPEVGKITPTVRRYQLQFRELIHQSQSHNKSGAIESRKLLDSSYRRGYNGYSLIVLSQSAYNLSHFPKLNERTKRDIIRSRSRKLKELGGDLDKYQSIQAHNAMYNDIDKVKLAELVVSGLGLKKLPDMKKANISQLEYSSKYIEYLQRIRKQVAKKQEEENPNQLQASLQLLSIVTNRFSEVTSKHWHHKRAIRAAKICERSRGEVHQGTYSHHRPSVGQSERTNILLHFPLTVNGTQVNYERIDEANVRLMMLYNPSLSAPNAASKLSMKKNRKNCNNVEKKLAFSASSPFFSQRPRIHAVNLKIFQLLQKNRRLQLDVRRIELESSKGEETRSQWLEFDVTEAVRGWLNRTYENLGIEIQCDRCRRFGARILSDHRNHDHDQEPVQNRFQLTPVLNIIGHVGRIQSPQTQTSRANQSQNIFYHRLTLDYPEQTKKKWPNSCYRTHQRCCRHQLDVTFKDLKGFEFIIQPKTFDAGFCKGRCPPRHNPAHHHALLQSLMWQQQRGHVPRPCCVPSKLTQLEILHVDEEHTDKLKISTWSDMQVVECACS